MNVLSLLSFLASVIVHANQPTQQQDPAPIPQTIAQEASPSSTIAVYTEYVKQEFAETYQGLGELGADFLADVAYATEPVSTIVVAGFNELRMLARDGATTLKQELLPVRSMIYEAQKKLEEVRSKFKIQNF